MKEILDSLGIKGPVLIIQIAGFLILYLLLRRFLFGPVAGMLRARQEEVEAGLKAAEDARAEAVRLSQDKDQILAQAREEGRGVVQKAVQEAQKARARLLAEAQEERAALLARGRSMLEVERKQTVLELRQQVSDLALMAASRAISETLDEAAQRRVVDAFITGVESSEFKVQS
jgi:F-type H+-transporting ATPase subunit b